MTGNPLALIWDLIAKDSASPAFLRVSGAADKAATSTLRTTSALSGANATMTKFGATLTKSVTLPLIGLAAVSVDQAAKFQTSLNTIKVATDQTAASMGKASTGLEQIAQSTGTSLSQLSDSLYTATKAGQPMAAALDTVQAAAEGAKAEHVDLSVATQALTSIMASYGKSLSNPVQAENELIRGAGLAKTTYADFAGSLSNVIPLASSLGISFANVAGAIDTMTQHGETAQQSTDNLSNLISNLAGSNTVASKALGQLGINSVSLSKQLSSPQGLSAALNTVLDAINKHGKDGMVVTSAFKQAQLATQSLGTELGSVTGTLKTNSEAFANGSMSYKDYLAYAKSLGGQQYTLARNIITTVSAADGFNSTLTSGNSTVKTLAGSLKTALGGVTGMRTALMLTGNSAETFSKSSAAVEAAAKTAGTSILGWSDTQKTLGVQTDIAKEHLQVLAVQIGDDLLPVGNKLIGWAESGVQWFQNLSSGTKTYIGYAALTAAALGPVLVVGGKLITMFGKLVSAVSTAGTAVLRSTGLMMSASDAAAIQMALDAESVANAEAVKAAKVAAAAAEIVEAQQAESGAATKAAIQALAAADQFAAAKQAEALAAQQSAEEIVAASEEAGSASSLALGPIGIGLTAVVGVAALAAHSLGLFGSSAKAQIKPTDDFTNAILSDNDALGTNTRALVENKLEKDGAYDAALKLGINQKTLTDAMTGNSSALAQVNSIMAAYKAKLDAANQSGTANKVQLAAQYRAYDLLASSVQDVTTTLKVNQTAANNLLAADGKLKGSTDGVSGSMKDLAAASASTLSSLKSLYSAIENAPKTPKVGTPGVTTPGLIGVAHPATGGYITGPGTGTSDSIPAMISNGEFVVNAAQTAKHLPMLHAINRGVQGFAAGGVVGGITYTTDTGYLNALSRATSALGKAIASFTAAVFKSTSTTADLSSAVSSLQAAAKTAGVSSSRLASASKLEAGLLGDAAKRDALNARLGTPTDTSSTAYDLLNAAKDAFSSEASTITQAIRSGFNIQTAGGTGPGGYASYAQTLSGITQSVSDATTFQADLKKLTPEFGKSKAGQELLQQLAEGGVTGSGPEVQALSTASAAQIQALVSQQAKLDAVAGATGNSVATTLDGAAVVKDQAVVNELVAQTKALSQKIDTIGVQVASALNGTARTSSNKSSTKPAGR